MVGEKIVGSIEVNIFFNVTIKGFNKHSAEYICRKITGYGFELLPEDYPLIERFVKMLTEKQKDIERRLELIITPIGKPLSSDVAQSNFLENIDYFSSYTGTGVTKESSLTRHTLELSNTRKIHIEYPRELKKKLDDLVIALYSDNFKKACELLTKQLHEVKYGV